MPRVGKLMDRKLNARVAGLTDYQRGVVTGWIKEAKCLRIERDLSLSSSLSFVEEAAADDVRSLYEQHWPADNASDGRGPGSEGA